MSTPELAHRDDVPKLVQQRSAALKARTAVPAVAVDRMLRAAGSLHDPLERVSGSTGPTAPDCRGVEQSFVSDVAAPEG